MKSIEFKEHNTTMGAMQKQYQPLYALRERSGRIISCWGLSWRERFRVFFTGKVWHSSMTFNKPLQPIFLTVRKEDLIN